jgi:hypothetical protein
MSPEEMAKTIQSLQQQIHSLKKTLSLAPKPHEIGAKSVDVLQRDASGVRPKDLKERVLTVIHDKKEDKHYIAVNINGTVKKVELPD